MADILLSYEGTDRQRVAPIVALLEARGWSVLSDAADPGDAQREPPPAGCIIAAWSFDSIESDAVLAVASHGMERGLLVSVSIDFSRPPQGLEQPSIPLAGWTGDESSPRAQELLAAVGEVLARAPAAPAIQPVAFAEPPPPEPPAPPAPSFAPPPPATYAAPSEFAEPEFAEREFEEPEYAEPEYAEPEYAEPEYAKPEYAEPEFGEPLAIDDEPDALAPNPAAIAQTQSLAARLKSEAVFEEEADAEAYDAEGYEGGAYDYDSRREPQGYAEPSEPVPQLVQDEGAAEPVWAFPGEDEEERGRPRLPPVLLRERGHVAVAPDVLPDAADAPAPESGRRGLVWLGLAAAVAIVAGAAGTLWMMPGGPAPGTTPGSEVAAVVPTTAPKAVETPPSTVAPPLEAKPPDASAPEAKQREAKPPEAKQREAAPPDTKPPEAKPPEAKPAQGKTREAAPQDTKPGAVQPLPAALPKSKDLDIEDILGQVTPRVEELLANARQLIRSGDIRAAREVLTAPETASSGSLTFLLAETYDPNVLPAAQKSALGNPERARALYRKARDLGDGRAQARLDALKTSGLMHGAASRAAGLLPGRFGRIPG